MEPRSNLTRSWLLKTINMSGKIFSVYIMTNKNNTVLYAGVTGNLKERVYEQEKIVKGFTLKYNLNELVYYEVQSDSYNAISREKQIKAGSRRKKIDLINGMKVSWKDLYCDL